MKKFDSLNPAIRSLVSVSEETVKLALMNKVARLALQCSTLEDLRLKLAELAEKEMPLEGNKAG